MKIFNHMSIESPNALNISHNSNENGSKLESFDHALVEVVDQSLEEGKELSMKSVSSAIIAYMKKKEMKYPKETEFAKLYRSLLADMVEIVRIRGGSWTDLANSEIEKIIGGADNGANLRQRNIKEHKNPRLKRRGNKFIELTSYN